MLREAVSYDRPPVVEPEREVAPPPPAPVPVPVTAPVAPAPEVAVEPGSMLAALSGATESDERSVVRRMAALVVLMTITLATAALVGAGIYRAVAGLD